MFAFGLFCLTVDLTIPCIVPHTYTSRRAHSFILDASTRSCSIVRCLWVRLFRLGQVCDELDFVPMDDFQKQFFLLRQDEWLDYKQNFPR